MKFGSRGEASPLVVGNEPVKYAAWKPLNIFLCVAVPLPLYWWLVLARASGLRHYLPWTAFTLGPLLTLGVCVAVAWTTWRHNRKVERDGDRGKRWLRSRVLIAITALLWVAWCAAMIAGARVYSRMVHPFCTYQDMAAYNNIDPSIDRGQAYMDAGQVYFKENSYVAKEEAMAFQSGRTYCAAPVLRQSMENSGSVEQDSLAVPASGTVDWWVVGVDCCDSNGQSFECGDVQSNVARAGLRELSDDDRPFFVLATQQWSVKMGVPVLHPLFLRWDRDPLESIEDKRSSAWKEIRKSGFIFLVVLLMLALALLRLLVK